MLLCVGTASNLDTPNRLKFETSEFFLKSADEMARRLSEIPEAITNTRQIAEMTELQMSFGDLKLPNFPVPEGHRRELAAGRVPGRPGAALRDGHAPAPGSPRLRGRRHHPDGLRRLLPDRRRLHPVRAGPGHRDHVPHGVERLLGAKRVDAHPDYARDTFETLLGASFRIAESLELSSGTRALYHAHPA